MRFSIETGVALPDRVGQPVEIGRDREGDRNEAPSFPGEFNRDDIRILAARELGVSSEVLLDVVNGDASSLKRFLLPARPLSDYDFYFPLINRVGCDISRLAIGFSSPFISDAVAQTIQTLWTTFSESLAHGEATRTYLLEAFVHELKTVAIETARFELNLAITEGFIVRESVQQTIESYVGLLDDNDYVAYLADKYPLLPVHIDRRLRLAASSVASFEDRLKSDAPTLRQLLDITGDDRVVSIHATLGDSHLGAGRVSVVEFASGKKAVYKPRGVQGEASFQAYLHWANTHSSLIDHRTIWVFDCGNYGWMEFVEAEEVVDHSAACDYFQRYGSLVALVHSVAGTDIHYENLIAAGSQPVIVDLETIVQPLSFSREEYDPRRYILNLDYFADTPLYTAMVDPAFLTKSLAGSPLNAIRDESDTVDRFEFDREGILAIVKDYSQAGVGASALRHNGAPLSFGDYIEQIVNGYRQRMTDLCLNKSELVGSVLPTIFGPIRVRVIFRYTRQYTSFVSALYSPYCMKSLRNSEEMLSSLWKLGLTTPAAIRLIPSEYRDIWNGDIPYFSAEVSSRDVIDSRDCTYMGVLELPGIEAVRTRLLNTSLPVVQDEAAIIEYCLHQCAVDRNGRTVEEGGDRVANDWQILWKDIAQRILIRNDRVLYMDPILNREQVTSQGMLGNDFGSGLPGVVFALAYCERFSQERSLHDKVRSLAHLAFLRDDHAGYEIGMCKGVGGLIYLAAHLGSLWGDPYFFSLGEHLAKRAGKLSWFDRHFDVYTGTAGAILAVVALMEASDSDQLIPVLNTLVRHLSAHAVVAKGVVAWPSSIPSTGGTTGFAHGVSGIAYALLRAYRRLPSDELAELIRGSERFISSCFSEESGSWLEDEGGAQTNIEVWCHGSPGICLFYEELCQQFDDLAYLERYSIALKNIVRFAEFENDSICHGTLGNVDLLLTLRRRRDSQLESIGGESVLKKIAEELSRRPFRCGNERHHDSLSLLTGLSGGAYQLLRLDQDGRIPALSAFEGPLRCE